ncbi:beta-N-acetylhexosaminidase [Hominenteromicrobium sp.]|uniref:beta-N-acetylhexosaminidase n=1 Tax=Hominenteromicrobium sp. TaxID=3073581 RepID=UPI003AB80E4B
MLNLIPAPRGSVHMQEGSVKLPETVTVSLGDFAPWCLEAFAARLDGHVETVENGFITLKKADIAKEDYKLTVTKDGITVEAADESGAVWALTTVTELTAEGEALPIVTIEDAPHYGHRGLSLDCSRHFFTADEVKKVIDQMTRVKLNVLHWHLVDDQGWRIECKTLPLLHETTGTYYTQEEIRSVIEYARVRGMEIIPEIDMPGHTRSMIAAYPHLSCFGEKTELCQFGGIFEKILCPGKDETFEFIEKLLTEVCALFPDDRFHIGGDEAPKTEWKKCPHCKARMEALGLTDYEDLQGYFTKRVVAILKKHGKRAVCWNDVLESKDVDTENIIQYWTAQHEAPVPAFIERGGKVIFSNMSALYFDYPHGINSLNKVYHYQPVVMGKSYADSPNMLGYEAALWSEQVETPEHLEELLFPRLYAVSEIAWNEAGDYADFEHRAEKKIEIAAKQGVNCMTKDGWNPEGEARVQSAATFIAHMMNPGGIGTPHTDAEREMVRPVIEKFAQIWFRPQDVPEMMKNDDLVGAALNFMKMFPPENDETKGE